MSHFAEIINNVVQRVVVVPDNQEHRGQEFLANDLKLGGTWIQCSYNVTIRKHYPGPGYTYDPVNDIFISPCPHDGWILNKNFDWEPAYVFDTETQKWISNT